MNDKIKVGYGWRLLDDHETYIAGDQVTYASYLAQDVMWYDVGRWIGTTVDHQKNKHANALVSRRKIDVGEGYRLVELHELVSARDECASYRYNFGVWKETCACGKTPPEAYPNCEYRGVAYRTKIITETKQNMKKKFKEASIYCANEDMFKAITAYTTSLGYRPVEQNNTTREYIVLFNDGSSGTRLEHFCSLIRFDASTEFAAIVKHLSTPAIPVVNVKTTEGAEYEAHCNKDFVQFGCAKIANETLLKARLAFVSASPHDENFKLVTSVTIGKGVFTRDILDAIVTHPQFQKGE